MHWYSSTCNNWPWNFAAMVINIFTAFVACPIIQTMTVTHRSAGKNTIAEHIHTMLEGLHKLLLLNDWNEFYSDWQYFNWYSINMWWGPYNIRVQFIFLSPSPPHHFFDVVFHLSKFAYRNIGCFVYRPVRCKLLTFYSMR